MQESKLEPEQIARVCHEVNRGYCQALGDDSQEPWDAAPQWQRERAESGVQMHLANPDAGPEATHEHWLAEKRSAGWTFGLKKDEHAKTHPCCCAFEGLPVAQQAKGYIFRAVVHAFK